MGIIVVGAWAKVKCFKVVPKQREANRAGEV